MGLKALYSYKKEEIVVRPNNDTPLTALALPLLGPVAHELCSVALPVLVCASA